MQASTAWLLGPSVARNTRKALLIGLLRPLAMLRAAEEAGDHTARLALSEDWKSLPWGAVWDEFCLRHETPRDGEWLREVRTYEQRTLRLRV